MFFEIGPKTYDPNFSYIIAKHPDNIFERNLKDGRIVKACFNKEKRLYRGYVQNDPLVFLKTARKLNLSSYVHIQLSAICPYNLKGFDVVFRSALRGNNSSSETISNEEFFKPRNLEAFIGPYPGNYSLFKKLFTSVNIKPTIKLHTINKTSPDKLEEDKLYKFREAYMLQLETQVSMSVTEFLQKIYLISYYGTFWSNLVKISNEQVEKFVSFCKDWLDRCEYRNNIINKLCKYHKGLIEKFETSLIEIKDLRENEKKEKLDAIYKFLHKKGLHEKRHTLVKKEIKKLSEEKITFWQQIRDYLANVTREPRALRIVDLGCGEGKMLKELQNIPKVKILGIEADSNRVERVKRKTKISKVKVINSNLLYPNVTESDLLPDILTSMEVIEHLEKKDRQQMICNIRDFFQPEIIILSTPNKFFNKYFGLNETEKRHNGHKIEYTFEELEKEVVKPLLDLYKIEYLKLLPEYNAFEQPSFVIKFIHKRPEIRKINYKMLRKINEMYHTIYMDKTNYNINSREISNGYSSNQMIINKESIFYMAPTIAPVEYNPKYEDYLEHPESAFNYYKSRGITSVVAEEKEMGSRAYVMIFKTLKHAQALGFPTPIIINSRQGYPFFNRNNDCLLDLWSGIKDKLKYDFIILDCEVLPWNLKARGLIEKDFLVPGQCAWLSRYYGIHNSLIKEDYKKADKYLKVLETFASDKEMQFKMFQVLAYGQVDITKHRFVSCINGLFLNKQNNYNILKSLENDVFKSIKGTEFSLNSESDCYKITQNWEEYCKNGGEGYVFKPSDTLFMPTGYFIQPALKVRGKDYLRLIYGIDYLDKDYFNKISRRQIKKKRVLALREFDLSLKILNAFLYRNKAELYKSIAGFIGMENHYIAGIDATL